MLTTFFYHRSIVARSVAGCANERKIRRQRVRNTHIRPIFSVFRLELKTYLFRQPILHGYYFAACVNEHVIAIAFRPVTETYGKPNMRKVIDRNRFETHLSVCTAVFLLVRSATKQNIIQ